jgi:hypothetical protein
VYIIGDGSSSGKLQLASAAYVKYELVILIILAPKQLQLLLNIALSAEKRIH